MPSRYDPSTFELKRFIIFWRMIGVRTGVQIEWPTQQGGDSHPSPGLALRTYAWQRFLRAVSTLGGFALSHVRPHLIFAVFYVHVGFRPSLTEGFSKLKMDAIGSQNQSTFLEATTAM